MPRSPANERERAVWPALSIRISGKNSSAIRSTSTGVSCVLKKWRIRESGARLARGTDRLNPVHSFERKPGIRLATELNRRCPVPAGRKEKTTRVCTELLLLFEAVAGVRPVRARGKDSPLAGLDRLSGLLVLNDNAIEHGLERPRRHRVHCHSKRIAIGPQAKLERLRIGAAAAGKAGRQHTHECEAAKHQA